MPSDLAGSTTDAVFASQPHQLSSSISTHFLNNSLEQEAKLGKRSMSSRRWHALTMTDLLQPPPHGLRQQRCHVDRRDQPGPLGPQPIEAPQRRRAEVVGPEEEDPQGLRALAAAARSDEAAAAAAVAG